VQLRVRKKVYQKREKKRASRCPEGEKEKKKRAGAGPSGKKSKKKERR